MYTFGIIYYLTQACLGEITSNFRRIYVEVNQKEIKVFFFLSTIIESDIENIDNEIMFYFINSIEDQPELECYTVTSEIFFGENGYLNKEDYVNLNQIFHKKENSN